MARKKKIPGGDPSAARNPVAEDDGADAPLEPGAAASVDVNDDGPLPEELEEDGEEEETPPPPSVPDRSVHVSPETPPAPAVPHRSPELRRRLGEPDPFPGAIIDPQTGRVENAPSGWDPKRRPPQKP